MLNETSHATLRTYTSYLKILLRFTALPFAGGHAILLKATLLSQHYVKAERIWEKERSIKFPLEFEINQSFLKRKQILWNRSYGALVVQKCLNILQKYGSSRRSHTTSSLPLKYSAVRSSEVARSTTYRPSELPIHNQLLSLQGPTQKCMEKQCYRISLKSIFSDHLWKDNVTTY